LDGVAQPPLLPDEAYYYEWAQHPDLAYFDNPGGIAYIVRLSTWIGGHSEFGVRWLNALIGSANVALMIWLGGMLFSLPVGMLSGLMVAVGAPYVLLSRFVYTDALHLCAVLITVGLFWRWRERPTSRYLSALLAGLGVAVMFNTKYPAYLVSAGLGFGILLDRSSRLREPPTWLLVGVSLVGLGPVLVWNRAHDWGSLRWQLEHVLGMSPGSRALGMWQSWARNLVHGVRYVTWPLALVGIAGLANAKAVPRRYLLLVVLAGGIPLALSPADSPRNLTTNLALAAILCGDLVVSGFRRLRRGRARLALLMLVGCLMALLAAYGVGSRIALGSDLGHLPVSSAVSVIRADSVGWPDAGYALSGSDAVYAVDYSIAGQLSYYSGSPVITSWPQYWLWEPPSLDPLRVVARDFVEPACVSHALSRAFAEVDGPRAFRTSDGLRLNLWDAESLQVPTASLQERLDFLTLYRCEP
jgi:hypothetical protein